MHTQASLNKTRLSHMAARYASAMCALLMAAFAQERTYAQNAHLYARCDTSATEIVCRAVMEDQRLKASALTRYQEVNPLNRRFTAFWQQYLDEDFHDTSIEAVIAMVSIPHPDGAITWYLQAHQYALTLRRDSSAQGQAYLSTTYVLPLQNAPKGELGILEKEFDASGLRAIRRIIGDAYQGEQIYLHQGQVDSILVLQDRRPTGIQLRRRQGREILQYADKNLGQTRDLDLSLPADQSIFQTQGHFLYALFKAHELPMPNAFDYFRAIEAQEKNDRQDLNPDRK